MKKFLRFLVQVVIVILIVPLLAPLYRVVVEYYSSSSAILGAICGAVGMGLIYWGIFHAKN